MDSFSAASLCRTYSAYFALGGDVTEGPGCRAVRQDANPLVYDVNHLQVGPEAELDAALAFFEASLGDRTYRRIMTDPFTPPGFAATLSLESYLVGPTLQGLLTGTLQGPMPRACEIRPVDGAAVAYFSSWPGIAGVGMVEDLFTLPSHRGRGIARALIHHGVADARTRGAQSVLIGSDPDDTPKHLYAAMGFEPTCVTWGWTRIEAA
jgi:GNAT superfamily N-acetyltransferase